MGVDGFRVDTVRHIPRIALNLMYNDQILGAAKAAGKSNFPYVWQKFAQDLQMFGIVAMPKNLHHTILGKNQIQNGLTSGHGVHQLMMLQIIWT